MNKDAKILLPGGAGLVGQNLVAHLAEQGYQNMVVQDKHGPNLDILKKMHPQVQAVHVDLADPGAWQEHFQAGEAVVMLQAQIGDLQREPFIRNNITSTKNVLEAIKRHKVPYTVHISSSVVNSSVMDFYVRTKMDQEELVVRSGVPCVVLRPTLMFGWFDRKHLGWLSRFMKRVPVFPVPGHGRYMRQPLYAGDFAAMIASCLQSRISGQVLDITGLEKIDYIDIIRKIKQVTGSTAAIVKIPYGVFWLLLKIWAAFDKNPPFTASQLTALVAHDEFEVIDWQGLFGVTATPFEAAIEKTFNHPEYSKIILEF
jgi:nucleoside-diphosphate-sugar epimerase